MDKLDMTPEQQLAFDGFIDVMVQIYKMTSDKIDYSSVSLVAFETAYKLEGYKKDDDITKLKKTKIAEHNSNISHGIYMLKYRCRTLIQIGICGGLKSEECEISGSKCDPSNCRI